MVCAQGGSTISDSPPSWTARWGLARAISAVDTPQCRASSSISTCFDSSSTTTTGQPSYSHINDLTSTLFGNRTTSLETNDAVVFLPSTKSCRIFVFSILILLCSDICNETLWCRIAWGLMMFWFERKKLEDTHLLLEKAAMPLLFPSRNEMFMTARMIRPPNSHSIPSLICCSLLWALNQSSLSQSTPALRV